MSLNQHFSTQPVSSTKIDDDASMMGRQQKIDDMRLRVERQLQAMLTGTSNDFTTLRKQVEGLKTKPLTVNSRRASTGDDRSTHTSTSSLPPEPQEIVWLGPADNSRTTTQHSPMMQQKLIVTESYNSKADPQEITWNPNALNQNTASQASTTVSQMLLGDDDIDHFEEEDVDFVDNPDLSQDLTTLEDTTVAAPTDIINQKEENKLTRYVMNQHVTDPYGDQGEYTGTLTIQGNRPHGLGTMKYQDRRVYTGSWQEGQWHGKGTATFQNGDLFDGTYDLDRRHGFGLYKWNDGREYEGEFHHDQRHGCGEYTWPDGAIYRGEFQAGHRHGEGTYTFADASVYTGEWQKGRYHGVGQCTWKDGRLYKGEWHAGKAHGFGIETRANGTVRHEGQWSNDNPVRK